eukprot:TRINITY_DN30640_c0_g1_i1.p1 TRINITY_DN30640_c0_g1~~TRINITY_DN30640_c0_g1_i1.p1  ORF type:complete len:448 (+),score=137.70 TRINITY_DN30640_c0_g1_i1:93-1436(+)
MSHIFGCKQTPPTPPTTSDEDSSGNTSDDETKKKKGNRAMGKKKYPKAIKYYSKAIKLAPENPTYRLNRAIANAALELWKAAEEDASKAVELADPAPAKSHFQLARAKFKRGNCDDALEALQAGLKAYPNEAALLQLEKDVKREKEKRQAAYKKAQEAATLPPTKPPAAGPGSAKALLDEARAAYNRGQPDKAIAICKSAREAVAKMMEAAGNGSPEADAALREETSILSLLGKSCMQLRRWPEAVEAFQAVVEIEEDLFNMDKEAELEALSNAYNNLGIATKNTGRMDDAVKAMRTAYVKLTNGDDKVATMQASQILQNIGQCLRAQKKPGEAKTVFSRSLEIGLRLVGAEHASQALGHICVARCQRDEGNIREAMQSFLEAIKIWESKPAEEVLKETPELPNKDRLAQMQEQVKQELAQLVYLCEQAKENAQPAAPEQAAATAGG